MLIYKAWMMMVSEVKAVLSHLSTQIKFRGNGVKFSSFRTNGVPYVMVSRGGKMAICERFAMNNGIHGNPIGCYDKCTFFVAPGAELVIGHDTGISQSALIAINSLYIGNYVKIGGGTAIYTSDFHSLDARVRASADDIKHRASAPVVIGDNVFIGARCTILKGVTIGDNSIIGAGSVVTKSIPANEIWAGNPAKFIRSISRS